MLWIPKAIVIVGAVLFAVEARAGEQLNASFDLKDQIGKTLRITKDKKPVVLAESRVRVALIDRRPDKNIERVILDPTYHPPKGEFSEFYVQTTILVQGIVQPLSETALCDWNGPKSVATCSIEDDGGRFQISAKRAAGKPPALSFIVRRLLDYRGFRIAEDDFGIEPVPIDLELIGKNPVVMPLLMD